ncbi:MAG: NAD-dependent epimerase/dehydratase family protein [Paludibacteraceae bacterium]|nr:NAD-dependent epimerase/dehydratase family protein [Paludibacteraceae bacterium]
MEKKKEILIIGGSGVLSTAVVGLCIDNGWNVTMINRGRNTQWLNPKATLIKSDVNDDERIKAALGDRHFDVCIDFIIFTKDQLVHSLGLFGRVADQYVMISSAQVYNTNMKGWLDEDSETPQKVWRYSVNKEESEKYLRDYCEKEGVHYTIIRPGVNYDNRRIPYGMGPQMGAYWTMIERIKHGKPIILWDGGKNKLNLTRVEDFASGLFGLLGKEEAYNNTFNVVGDYVYTWKEVCDELEKILGLPVKTIDVSTDFYATYLTGERKEMLIGGRACDLCCSNKRLKEVVTDYRAKYDLHEGLKLTVDYMNAHPTEQWIDYMWEMEQDYVIKQYLKSTHQPKDPSLRFVNYDGLKWVDTIKMRYKFMKRIMRNNRMLRKLFRKQ